MNKKIISALLCGAMVLSCAAPVMAADKAGDGQKIALVGKSAGNAFLFIRKLQQQMLRSKFLTT